MSSKKGIQLERALPLYEQIYQTIKDQIFKGEYKPGEKIYEVQIAKEFSVSRSPVREAVRALMKEGLITIDEKSQIRIYEPTAGDVEEIYQCRTVLESLAVKLSTLRATDNQLEEIKAILLKTQLLLDEDKNERNFKQIIEYNTKFHDIIIQFSENQRLEKILRDLWSLTHFYRVINSEGKGRLKKILQDHWKIYNFMKERENEKACEMMIEHMKNDLHHFRSLQSNTK